MTSRIYNNCFYGQTNSFSGIQAAPSSLISYPAEHSDFHLGDLQIPAESFYDQAIFQEDNETSSDTSCFLKASKKISKSSESSKKVQRKKHNKARNPWTPKEDAKLVELMKKHGQSWAMISAAMEGRSGKQIRDRFLNKLRPNIKCGDWRNDEDELLIKLLSEVGNRWSLIATHLPGRTEGQVKNRYYSSIKKRIESNGTLSQTSGTRTASETVVTTPEEAEEANVDFTGFEFDVNVMNGCATFVNHEPAQPQQHTGFMVSKGPYAFEEDYSEESTTQSGNSRVESPFRYPEATSAIAYEPAAHTFFFEQAQEPFFLAPIEHDNQIDDMLNNVTNYFMEKSPVSSDVDSYFSDDLRGENEKLAQLSRRKAYLELALAKTLKEIKGL
jgi:hypothetical protein